MDQLPNPKMYRNIGEWANALYEHMASASRVTSVNDPLPVLLPHRTSARMERAATDGILLFDPQYDTPVVAVAGNWDYVVSSSDIARVVMLADEAAYDALPVKDPQTLYIWP